MNGTIDADHANEPENKTFYVNLYKDGKMCIRDRESGKPDATNPDTGDTTSAAAAGMLTLLAGGAAVVIRRRKKSGKA